MGLVVKDGNNTTKTIRSTTKTDGDVPHHFVDDPFFLRIARDKVTNFEIVHVFGKNPSISDAAEEDVTRVGDTHFYQTSATTLTVSSSDANDTSAGSGAQTILITGVDSSYNVLTETVSMAGTTPVVTSGQFLRSYDTIVATAGATDTNEGVITVEYSSGQPAAIISINATSAFMALYTVATGKTAYLIDMTASNENTAEIFRFRLHNVTSPRVVVAEMSVAEGSAQRSFNNYGLSFAAQSDIALRAQRTGSGGAQPVTGTFTLLVIDNTEA